MVAWFHLLAGLVGAGAIGGVGLAMVRPLDRRAGWLLAGAGALLLLGTGCVRAGDFVAHELAFAGSVLINALTDLAAFALAAAAIWRLARLHGAAGKPR